MSGKNVATTRLCHAYDFGNYVATARLRVTVVLSSHRRHGQDKTRQSCHVRDGGVNCVRRCSRTLCSTNPPFADGTITARPRSQF